MMFWRRKQMTLDEAQTRVRKIWSAYDGSWWSNWKLWMKSVGLQRHLQADERAKFLRWLYRYAAITRKAWAEINRETRGK